MNVQAGSKMQGQVHKQACVYLQLLCRLRRFRRWLDAILKEGSLFFAWHFLDPIHPSHPPTCLDTSPGKEERDCAVLGIDGLLWRYDETMSFPHPGHWFFHLFSGGFLLIALGWNEGGMAQRCIGGLGCPTFHVWIHP